MRRRDAATDEVFEELKELRKQSAKADNWQEVNAAGSELRRKINSAQENVRDRQESIAPQPSTRPVKAGDIVQIISIGTKAEVIDILLGQITYSQSGNNEDYC